MLSVLLFCITCKKCKIQPVGTYVLYLWGDGNFKTSSVKISTWPWCAKKFPFRTFLSRNFVNSIINLELVPPLLLPNGVIWQQCLFGRVQLLINMCPLLYKLDHITLSLNFFLPERRSDVSSLQLVFVCFFPKHADQVASFRILQVIHFIHSVWQPKDNQICRLPDYS